MAELSWMAKLRELNTHKEWIPETIIEKMSEYGKECEAQIDKDMANQSLLEEHIAIENFEKAKKHLEETKEWLKQMGIEWTKMTYECTNCCEEIEDGKEIQDDEGNYFCCQNHLDKWHMEEDGDEGIADIQKQEDEDEDEENKSKYEAEQAAKADEAYDDALAEKYHAGGC